jgi:hypothetical protein
VVKPFQKKTEQPDNYCGDEQDLHKLPFQSIHQVIELAVGHASGMSNFVA